VRDNTSVAAVQTVQTEDDMGLIPVTVHAADAAVVEVHGVQDHAVQDASAHAGDPLCTALRSSTFISSVLGSVPVEGKICF
jgi:hypothetical protein